MKYVPGCLRTAVYENVVHELRIMNMSFAPWSCDGIKVINSTTLCRSFIYLLHETMDIGGLCMKYVVRSQSMEHQLGTRTVDNRERTVECGPIHHDTGRICHELLYKFSIAQ